MTTPFGSEGVTPDDNTTANLSEGEINASQEDADIKKDENRKANAEAADQEALTGIKKDYANKIFWFMVSFAIFVAIILSLYFYQHISSGTIPPESVIIALITTTFATVVGLVGFIVKGLFGSK